MQLFKKTNIDFIGKDAYRLCISPAFCFFSRHRVARDERRAEARHRFHRRNADSVGFQTVGSDAGICDRLLTSEGYADAELQDFAEDKSVIIRVQESKVSAPVLGQQLQSLIASKFPGSDPIVPARGICRTGGRAAAFARRVHGHYLGDGADYSIRGVSVSLHAVGHLQYRRTGP